MRKRLAVPFAGETNEDITMLLADVRVEGLDHEYGHGWMLDGQTFFGFTPLAGGDDTYAVNTPASGIPPTREGLQQTLEVVSGRADILLRELTWSTIWRPNVRMVKQFRVGRVLLAGDAAHVHPPTGGQGLNTGVQDAYNLGWKLAAVLDGVSDELLDSYEASGCRSPRGCSASALRCWKSTSAAPTTHSSAARKPDNSTSTTGSGH